MKAQLLQHSIVVSAATALSLAVTFAQSLPPRDSPPRQPAGTARINAWSTHGPGSAVARARVQLNGPPGQRPPVLSDDEGRFEFAELPAGSFTLYVQKSGYVFTRYPDPGRTVRANNRMLTVSDGQTLGDVTVPMYHGAVITGRVTDAHGDPVEFANVQALKLPSSGRGQPAPRGGTQTNDLGEYMSMTSTGWQRASTSHWCSRRTRRRGSIARDSCSSTCRRLLDRSLRQREREREPRSRRSGPSAT